MTQTGETLQWTPATAKPEPRASLYDADEYSWLLQQANLLRDGRFEDLDRSNLVEFLRDMTQTHKDKFESAARVLLHHLLKVQPEKLTRSWALTIAEQQVRAGKVIANNPGMKRLLPSSTATPTRTPCAWRWRRPAFPRMSSRPTIRGPWPRR